MAGLKRIEFRDRVFNQRTIDMIRETERNLGFSLGISQGSYTTKVKASALTHKGGGAADIRARTLGEAERSLVVRELRRVGFAAWLRLIEEGFDSIHIHAIAVNDPELSEGPGSAARQVQAYKNGRNGLKNNGKDTGPREFVSRTWEQYKAMRAVPDATGTSTLEEKKADVHLSVKAVRMAAAGKPISHTFAFDAEQFMAFAAAGIKVVPLKLLHDWRAKRDAKSFVTAVKAVQRKFKLLEDGDPGPITLGRMERFGYFITA
jgi:hypothetical protein